MWVWFAEIIAFAVGDAFDQLHELAKELILEIEKNTQK